MRPEERDAALLWDMLDAAISVRSFCEGRTYRDFTSDKMLRRAVEREIQIIGEAASKVSRPLEACIPGIPWKKIISQRHVLVHEYGEIKDELVWQLATIHVPDLELALRRHTEGK